MIKCFLYQMNEKNKRVITGLIENDDYQEFDPLYEYPMILEDSYILEENDNKISNFGKQYYAITELDSINYLNLNDFMLKVKLNLTNNVAFASTLSKDMLMSIFENTNYFNCDTEYDYIDSGLTLCQDKGYKDYFDGWFRNVTDDVYVMLTNMRYPLYIGKENNQYILTDDFKNAFRVSKKECRNLLIANGFIDTTMRKKQVSFSHYNCFECKNQYGFAGENSFYVSYNNDTLKISKNFKPTTEWRLISDEARAKVLRDICYKNKKGPSGNKLIFKVNDKYCCEKTPGVYELTNDATLSTPLDTNLIDVLKVVFKIYFSEPKYEAFKRSSYALYNNNGTYILSNDKLEYPSKLISDNIANKFFQGLEETKLNAIAKCKKGYIDINIVSSNSFNIEYKDSAYDINPQSSKLLQSLEGLLDLKINIIEPQIIDIYQDNNYVCKIDKPLSCLDSYYLLQEEVYKCNIRLNDNINISEIKTESDKGALEYLTRFYLKSSLDTNTIFSMILKKENINNCLILGNTTGADLVGISNALYDNNKSLDLFIIENIKWGFRPKTFIYNKLNIIKSIRMPILSLNKNDLNYDLIFISRSFKDEEELNILLNNLKNENKKTVVVITGICNYFTEINISTRKHLKTKELNGNIYNSILDSNLTYVSILYVGFGKIKDVLKK